jgi:hypothetical protein
MLLCTDSRVWGVGMMCVWGGDGRDSLFETLQQVEDASSVLREYLLNWAKRDGRLAYCDSAVGQLLPECAAELSAQASGTTVDSAASRRLRTLWAHMHVLRAQLGGALAPVLAAEAEKAGAAAAAEAARVEAEERMRAAAAAEAAAVAAEERRMLMDALSDAEAEAAAAAEAAATATARAERGEEAAAAAAQEAEVAHAHAAAVREAAATAIAEATRAMELMVEQEARREAAAAAAAEAAAEATAAAAAAAKRMGLGLSDASAVMIARLLIGSLLLGPWVWPLARVLARSLNQHKSGPSPEPSPGNTTTNNRSHVHSARGQPSFETSPSGNTWRVALESPWGAAAAAAGESHAEVGGRSFGRAGNPGDARSGTAHSPTQPSPSPSHHQSLLSPVAARNAEVTSAADAGARMPEPLPPPPLFQDAEQVRETLAQAANEEESFLENLVVEDVDGVGALSMRRLYADDEAEQVGVYSAKTTRHLFSPHLLTTRLPKSRERGGGICGENRSGMQPCG